MGPLPPPAAVLALRRRLRARARARRRRERGRVPRARRRRDRRRDLRGGSPLRRRRTRRGKGRGRRDASRDARRREGRARADRLSRAPHAGDDLAPPGRARRLPPLLQVRDVPARRRVQGARRVLAALASDAGGKARGVVAFSSGNHAQAVALAAKELGVSAVIVMPHDAPALKLAATRGYGADVRLYDRAEGEPREDRRGRSSRTRAGSSCRRSTTSPSSRGRAPPGSSCSRTCRTSTPSSRRSAEAGSSPAWRSPRGRSGRRSASSASSPRRATTSCARSPRGIPSSIPVPATIADCLQTTKPGVHTFALVSALVEGVVTVSDLELRRAMSLLFAAMKLVVEPGATAGFAGVLSGRVTESLGQARGRRAVGRQRRPRGVRPARVRPRPGRPSRSRR